MYWKTCSKKRMARKRIRYSGQCQDTIMLVEYLEQHYCGDRIEFGVREPLISKMQKDLNKLSHKIEKLLKNLSRDKSNLQENYSANPADSTGYIKNHMTYVMREPGNFKLLFNHFLDDLSYYCDRWCYPRVQVVKQSWFNIKHLLTLLSLQERLKSVVYENSKR